MIFQRRAVKLSVASSANVLSLWARFAMLALLEVWSLVLRILCSFFQFVHSSPRGWGQKTDCEQSTFSRAWYCWCFFLWLSRNAPLVNCIFCFKLRLNHCAVSVGYDWLKWLFWLNGAGHINSGFPFYSVVFLCRTLMLTFHILLASDEMRCGTRTGLKWANKAW